MDGWLFSFMTASALMLLFPALPVAWLLPVLLFGALWFAYGRHWVLSGLLTGVVWMASVGHWQLAWQLPNDKIRQVVIIEGRVETLLKPESSPRFTLRLTKFDEQSLWRDVRVRLSWRDTDWSLEQDQVVRLAVRLRPPHSMLNMGGFNYQQWLFASGIRATGYVTNAPQNKLLAEGNSVRQWWLSRFAELDIEHRGWLAALSMGYRGWLEADDWSMVQRTGIAHLIAISGLHLGMVSAFIYGLVTLSLGPVLGRFRQRINLHKLALVTALLATLGYAALAGFSLPTLRAWLMLALFVMLLSSNLQWQPRRILLVCLALFVLLFPLSLLTVSFWLSFAAVLILYLVFWRWPTRGRGWAIGAALSVMLRVQLALSLLMLPLVAWQFGLVSWVSPLVNLFAVPFVTLLLLPLCLVALLILGLHSEVGQWLFALADKLVDMGLSAIAWLEAELQSALLLPAISAWIWLSVALAAIWLFMPRGLVPRSFGWLLLLPLVSTWLPSRSDAWHIEVLDIGQGLAVVVHRQGRALLYDTGPAYYSGSSAASAHVLPALRALGIRQLDWLFISHQDNDHAGGQADILEGVAVLQLMTNLGRCQADWQQQWQGLDLQVLWPQPGEYSSQNNQSCVLKISDGQNVLLLPGDIEKKVESRLVATEDLRAQILVAPHHGSATSSSTDFIQAVRPQHVVFSLARFNRWGFPRPEVVTAYQAAGAITYDTASSGQIRFKIEAGQIQVQRLRHFAYNRWFMQ